ncbi:MAG: hypothetical protein ACD_44C00206G0017 [uncultured bacterium]|nr:MAG: hypothetical protein ACD_44C00206G0017 [uncultured bacterium]
MPNGLQDVNPRCNLSIIPIREARILKSVWHSDLLYFSFPVHII